MPVASVLRWTCGWVPWRHRASYSQLGLQPCAVTWSCLHACGAQHPSQAWQGLAGELLSRWLRWPGRSTMVVLHAQAHQAKHEEGT